MPDHNSFHRKLGHPAAIVLGLHGTGLRTARCLAEAGIEVHAVSLDENESGRKSRYVHLVDRFDLSYEDDRIISWLLEYATRLGNRPVVFPICDAHALALARNHDRLHQVCRSFATPIATLERIVGKDGLYETAAKAGALVPPAIVEPTVDQLRAWCSSNAPPYFAKPYFQGIEVSSLREKNRVFPDASSILEYVTEHGSTALIIQRMLRGGDGWIYDCYGFCDRNGAVVTLASHRRIRQLPVDTGTTCFGEIPAAPRGREESVLFDLTTRLLAGLGYHGIFGIEWLQERETGDLYVLDFNARPFSTVNHLKDCGLNLPLIAYRELIGEDISEVERTPRLRHKTWMGMNRDLVSLRQTRRRQGASWLGWMRDLAGARSFGYWTFRDPGPGIDQLKRLVARLGRDSGGST